MNSPSSLSVLKHTLYRFLLKKTGRDNYLDLLIHKPLVTDFQGVVRRALAAQLDSLTDETIRDAVLNVNKRLSLHDFNKIRAVLEQNIKSISEFISNIQITDFKLQIYNASANHVVAKLGLQGSFDLKNPAIIAKVKDSSNLLIKTVDDTTKKQLSKMIGEGIENDKSWTQIAVEIRKEFPHIEKLRSQLIARMETANATNLAELDFYRQNGLTNKKWMLSSSHDPKTCDGSCDENADIGLISLNDVFPSGDDGPPSHINCKCVLNTEPPDDFIENGPSWLGE